MTDIPDEAALHEVPLNPKTDDITAEDTSAKVTSPAPPPVNQRARTTARVCITAVILCISAALVVVGTCKGKDSCDWMAPLRH